jgi:hypothetical protein
LIALDYRSGRTEEEELPAVDMFVTTADPRLEPPVVTVNTVLSLLALDYPAGKLVCYVSDDGCSPLTCFALREAAEFARLWVPFCRKHGVGVRAPFVYFSTSGGPPERGGGGAADDEFQRDWTAMKVSSYLVNSHAYRRTFTSVCTVSETVPLTLVQSEYDKLASRIENADEESLLRRGDGEYFAEFVGANRRDHPTIIKVEITSCTHMHVVRSSSYIRYMWTRTCLTPPRSPAVCVCRSCGTAARKGTATGYQASSTSRGRRAPGTPTTSRPGP